MPRRYAIKQPWKLPETLKGNKDRDYPMDMVYWTFIYSEQGIRGFCWRFGFNEEKFRGILKMTDWEQKKEANKERLYRTLAKSRLEKIEERQMMIDFLEGHDLAAIQSLVEDFNDQVKANKGYFVLDKDGKIERDSSGNPMMRMVPGRIKKAIKDNIELLELNTQALIGANAKAKIPEPMKLGSGEQKAIEGQVIDLEALVESEDDNGSDS